MYKTVLPGDRDFHCDYAHPQCPMCCLLCIIILYPELCRTGDIILILIADSVNFISLLKRDVLRHICFYPKSTSRLCFSGIYCLLLNSSLLDRNHVMSLNDTVAKQPKQAFAYIMVKGRLQIWESLVKSGIFTQFFTLIISKSLIVC